MVRLSEKETYKLVKLYRDHVCLWNNISGHYRNQSVHKAACEAIAREMNVEDFTAADVKSKLKNLRCTYKQEHLKIRRLAQSGAVNYVPNMKWFSIMETFINPPKNLQPPGDNSSSENADQTRDGISPEDGQWEQFGSNSESAPVSVSSAPSMPSESEIEQSIRSISETEVMTVTPEIQALQPVSNSEVYTVIPENESVSHSQVITLTPEILTVKAVTNSEPIPVTSGINSVKSVSNSEVITATPETRQGVKPVSNPSVTTVPSGIQTAKSVSSPQLFALIPEGQASKSVSNNNYIAISPGSKQNFRYVGSSQLLTLAPENQPRTKQLSADETLGSRKRRHEEVSSTNSNDEVRQINKTRAVADDFRDQNEDEMDAFGHFVALNLRKMSMQSALSAQTEILSVLTRHRLNDSATNLPPKQVVPYILTNGSSSTQNPVMLQKLFLKS